MIKIAVVVCVALVAGLSHAGVVPAPVIPAPAFVRTPSLDSAVIKSDRLGGNFAYSTVEGHAYAAVSPVVQRVVEPVAVSYTARQVPVGYAAAPVVAPAPVGYAAAPAPVGYAAAPAPLGYAAAPAPVLLG